MKKELMVRNPDLYFDSIHNELNNFLRDTIVGPMFSNPLALKKTSVWRPAVEVKQSNNAYKIKVQLPGVNKDDIEIDLDNDFMTITAKIEERKNAKKSRDFALADAIRDELLAKGITLLDTREGTKFTIN